MFSSKCSSGHVKCIFDDSVEKFRQISENFATKYKIKLKNKHVLDKISSKRSRDVQNAISIKMTKRFFKPYMFFAWVRG